MGLALRRFFSEWSTGDSYKVKILPSLVEMVEQAKREWIFAQEYFNYVEDQDLVDYAVYLIITTEKKYMYLLKQARNEGITYSPIQLEPENACSGIG